LPARGPARTIYGGVRARIPILPLLSIIIRLGPDRPAHGMGVRSGVATSLLKDPGERQVGVLVPGR